MSSDKSSSSHRLKRLKKSSKSNKIRFRTSFRNVVHDALKNRGWKETFAASSDVDSANDSLVSSMRNHDLEWDIIWADREWMRETFDCVHLEPQQKVNHFRNHYELTRKDTMAKNIKRRKRALYRSGQIDESLKYDFIPPTFALPHEYAIFVEEFKKNAKNNSNSSQYIMKPVGKCQGRGIFLFTKLSDVKDWKYNPSHFQLKNKEENANQPVIESYVVQKYIDRPLLIANKKFDLRIYVLVTSFSPLIAYIHRSGFARFTNSRYCNSASNLDNAYMHLTNAAVQKKQLNDSDLKWNLRSLKLHLITKYGEERVNELFTDIQDVIVKSLLCVQNVIISDKHCFELYGYDIMIDSELKAWLIEANAAPSFTASSNDDYFLKLSVIDDCLDIVMDKEGKNNDKLQVGGFDLVYKGGPVQHNERCLITSYLGCLNPSLQK